MPIRVTCQCGQSLSVPDEMAGKRGKCPKCKEILQIPAGTAKSDGTAAKAKGAPAKPAAAKPVTKSAPKAAPKPAQAPPASGLAGLFDEVGLKQKVGRTCPSCDAPVPNNSVLCVSCGFNFQEGKKLDGFQAESTRMFGNKHLNEAVQMMEREKSTEDRLMGAGIPWWMLFSILAGIGILIAGMGIKMNAGTTGEVSSIEPLRRIQEASYLAVLAATFSGAMAMTNVCALIAILITAFKESTKQGLLCFFAPFYIYYYMFSRLFSQYLVTTVSIYWGTLILSLATAYYAGPRI